MRERRQAADYISKIEAEMNNVETEKQLDSQKNLAQQLQHEIARLNRTLIIINHYQTPPWTGGALYLLACMCQEARTATDIATDTDTDT